MVLVSMPAAGVKEWIGSGRGGEGARVLTLVAEL